MDGGVFCCFLSMFGIVVGVVIWFLRRDSGASRLAELEATIFGQGQRIQSLEASVQRMELRLLRLAEIPPSEQQRGQTESAVVEVPAPASANPDVSDVRETNPESPPLDIQPAAYVSDVSSESTSPSSVELVNESSTIVNVASESAPEARATPLPQQTIPTAATPGQTWYAPPPTSESEPFAWEEWLGVKGAAAVGSMVLVVAAFYLFRYGVEHDWFNFSPAFRVSAALISGILCILASVPLRKRDQALLGDWLTGAGFAILYASIWAARALYHLLDTGAAGVGLAVVTISCGILATRRDAIVIAGLGLIGGFVTPLLLSTGVDRPISLFSYLLLLSLGVAFVARKKAQQNPLWNLLMVGALGFLAVYQIGWLVFNMDTHEVWIGSVVTFAFAGLFSVYGAELKKREPDSIAAVLLLVGSIGLAIVSTFVFALNAEVVLEVWPTAILVLPMLVLVEWIANREEVPYYGIPATLVATISLTAAVLCREAPATTWQLIWSLAPLMLVMLIAHGTLEFQHAKTGLISRISGAGVYFVPVALWVLFEAHRLPNWPFLVTLFAMILLGLRATHLAATDENLDDHAGPAEMLELGSFQRALATAAAAFALTLLSYGRLPEHTLSWFSLATILPFAFVSLLPSVRAPVTRVAVWFVSAWIVFAPLVLEARIESAVWLDLLLIVGLTLAYRARSGTSFAVVGVLFAIMHGVLIRKHGWGDDVSSLPFLLTLGAIILFFAAPLIFLRRILERDESESWSSPPSMLLNGVATTLVLLTLSALYTYNFAWGRVGTGFVAVALSLPALGVFLWARYASTLSDAWKRAITVRFVGLALCLLVVAIPLELSRQWITVGWALQGAALLWLYRRIPSRGLLLLGTRVFYLVAVRLVLNPYVLSYQERGLPIFNWLMYTYLLPAAAMAFGAYQLSTWLQTEEANADPQDLTVRRRGALLARNGLVALMFLVTFVWVNLTIFDAFGTQRFASISLERHATRDVVLSVAWGLYAVMLLTLGIWKEAKALRWASLALTYFSLFKMFFYDLANLEGLFRVLSLVGFAASFLTVSFVYKEFVFRGTAKTGNGAAGGQS